MASTMSYEWHDIAGTWLRKDGTISQTGLEGATRTYVELDMTDFILETSFILDEGKDGEAKIIFSDADKNEDYRIDFISGLNLCRITAGGIPVATLLHVAKNIEYHVKVTVKRNFISVKVNGMNLFSNFQFGKRSDGKVGLGTFQAKVTFTEPTFREFVSKKCFVIMPFDEKRDFLYETVIKPSLANHPIFAFEYSRADKLLTIGKITEEIDEKIKETDLIIADISEDNRNVYYELGIAHSSGKKVILLKQKVEGKPLDLPFDIKDFRTHPYEFSTEGFASLKERLKLIITNALQ